MPTTNTPASVESTAFACPHCGAYTTQHWFKLYARQNDDDSRTPNLPDAETRKLFADAEDIPAEAKPKLLEWCDRMMLGLPFFEELEQNPFLRKLLLNVNLSACYNCKKHSLWVGRNMVFPEIKSGPSPNQDLPENILRDFDEASSILNISPRGAAALLRLAVQKLCAHLGGKGKNIDEDIAGLVRKGLDPLVQQSLDIVRVIGNEAVHPGTIDLRDDQNTASRLFDLVNIIAQQMITQPNSIKAMYEKLPESKRNAIMLRDGRAQE